MASISGPRCGLLGPGLGTLLASPLAALPALPPGPCPGLVLPSSSSAWWPPEWLCRHTSHTEPPSFGFLPHFSSRSSAPWGSDLFISVPIPSTCQAHGTFKIRAGCRLRLLVRKQPGLLFPSLAQAPGPLPSFLALAYCRKL